MNKKKVKIKKNKLNEKTLAIKMLLSIIYLIVITILGLCAFKLFEEKKTIIPWSNVKNSSQYTYINISRMSEKFAYDSTTNIGYHYVIEKEQTGLWHTYLISINENNYDKYKAIIDYTYERTTKEPSSIKVYGYPVLIDTNLKALAIKNITKFVPAENEIEVTENNFENYLTNSYLDTAIPRKSTFDYKLVILMILLVIVFVLFILTVFYKDKQNIDKDKIKKIKNKKTIKEEMPKNENKTKEIASNNKKDNDIEIL